MRLNTHAGDAQWHRERAAGAAIADRASDCSVLADRAAKAEVEGIRKLAVVLYFFAFDADVGDPMLAATVGATGDVELELLIEGGEALIEFVDEPAGESLGFRDGQLAELRAGAGDCAAPEH